MQPAAASGRRHRPRFSSPCGEGIVVRRASHSPMGNGCGTSVSCGANHNTNLSFEVGSSTRPRASRGRRARPPCAWACCPGGRRAGEQQRYVESGEERCALLTETRHHGLTLHGMLLSLFRFRSLIGKSTMRVDRSPHPSSRTRAIDHENAERMGRWGFWGRASARLVGSHVPLRGGSMAVPWRTWWSRMSRRLFSSGVSVCVEFGRGLAARRWWWWARRCIVGPRGGHSLALVVVFSPRMRYLAR